MKNTFNQMRRNILLKILPYAQETFRARMLEEISAEERCDLLVAVTQIPKILAKLEKNPTSSDFCFQKLMGSVAEFKYLEGACDTRTIGAFLQLPMDLIRIRLGKTKLPYTLSFIHELYQKELRGNVREHAPDSVASTILKAHQEEADGLQIWGGLVR